MTAPLLQVSEARRSFAARQALQNVSLTLNGSEVVALLGPNGAGKTTLMRAISGRIKLGSGDVRIAGKDPLKDPAARRLLGIVPQTIALYPHLTARQNLDIFARLMGVRRRDVQPAVDLALQRADLADRAGELLTQLSGGMQRRLNIVAATLHGPQLLLLDEPTVGVDLHSREAIHALLEELCAAGMGILVSTHDFDQAAQLADRAAFMLDGHLLLEGAVDELIRDAFGDAREGVVAVADPTDANVRDILDQAGLRATRERRIWTGPIAGGYEALAQLEGRLEEAGAHVEEIRLRDPGLGGVFRQLIDRRSAP